MALSGYVEVRDLVVKLVYDDNGIIGKMFLYAETKTGVERRYIGFGNLFLFFNDTH